MIILIVVDRLILMSPNFVLFFVYVLGLDRVFMCVCVCVFVSRKTLELAGQRNQEIGILELEMTQLEAR